MEYLVMGMKGCVQFAKGLLCRFIGDKACPDVQDSLISSIQNNFENGNYPPREIRAVIYFISKKKAPHVRAELI